MSSITQPLGRLSVLLVGALALGCAGDKQAAPAKGAAEPTAKAPVASAPPEANKIKEIEGKDPVDDRYTLTIEPPSEVTVGAASVVRVKVVPKAPWHMNLDFPTSLAVRAPADVTVARPEQRKPEAVRLDDNGAEFAIDFTPASAGDKSFTGTFKFAVCQDDACSQVNEDLEFKVAVK